MLGLEAWGDRRPMVFCADEVQAADDGREMGEDMGSESAVQFQDLLNALPNASILTSLEGRIQFVNAVAERTFGYVSEELSGTPIGQLLGELAAVEALHRDGLEPGSRNLCIEVTGHRKDGTCLPLEVSSGEVRLGDRACRVFTVRDLTCRVRMESALRDDAARAQTVIDIAVEGVIMIDEIRTSVNAIVGMAGPLLDRDLTAKQRHSAGIVLSSAETLLGVTEDILGLSMIKSGKLGLDSVAFDLMQVVDDTIELFAARSSEKALELMVRYVPETPRHLIGDPSRIGQVLVNLLSNSVKFTDQGYVLVTVREAMRPGLPKGKKLLRISVKDTGRGIPREAQERIFQEFSPEAASMTPGFGGLGLPICKQLSAMMDGEIGVKSKEGSGSTFWCDFLLDEDRNAEAASPCLGDLRGLRVLVIADIAENRRLLYERLMAAGMDCVTCDSGKTSIETLRQAAGDGQPFQMAILDQRIPDTGGEGLVKQIKADEAIKDVVLVMLTPADGLASERRFAEIGVAANLSKPVRAEELVALLSLIWREFSAGNKGYIPFAMQEAHGPKGAGHALEDKLETRQILLVEDSRVNQLLATEALRSLGCEVTVVENGKKAVELASQDQFDLVFMDCEMPEMDGFEASRILTQMKKDRTIRNLPIVGLTGHTGEEGRERCLASGMNGILVKPASKEQLMGALTEWLPRRVESDDRRDPLCVLKNRSMSGVGDNDGIQSPDMAGRDGGGGLSQIRRTAR